MSDDITHPLVSVLICTYDCESYINNTLDSIINQEYSNIEILVRDDNSTDETPNILQDYSKNHEHISIFLGENNIGPYNGLNYLLEKANGKYIAIQDHDDIWHPEKLKLQIRVLENSEYKACGGLAIKLFEGTNKIGYVSWPKIDYYAPHPSLVFINEGYRYETDLTYKGDMYFMKYTLSCKKKNIYNIQKPLYVSLVRSDEENLSEQWTSPTKILKYYQQTRDNKYLLFYILSKILPQQIINLIRKSLSQDWEYDEITSMKKDKFEKKFMKYIQEYVS